MEGLHQAPRKKAKNTDAPSSLPTIAKDKIDY
jgi:hypothetical protein